MMVWFVIDFLKHIITANVSELQVLHIVVELRRISVSSKGLGVPLLGDGVRRLFHHTALLAKCCACLCSRWLLKGSSRICGRNGSHRAKQIVSCCLFFLAVSAMRGSFPPKWTISHRKHFALSVPTLFRRCSI